MSLNDQRDNPEINESKIPAPDLTNPVPGSSEVTSPATQYLRQPKKNFRHYFSEFLMIFLAVTMGFIAENIRERFTENEKEKQYIMSFVDGLKTDTATIKTVMTFNNGKIRGLDSIAMLAKQNMDNNANRARLYTLIANYLSNYTIFRGNDITMQQLKYAGDLRIIRRRGMADSLVTYDQFAGSVRGQGEVTEKMFLAISDLQEQILDYTLLFSPDYGGGQIPVVKEQEKLKWLFNKIILYRAVLDFYNNRLLPDNLKAADDLIRLLKKEYRIKDR